MWKQVAKELSRLARNVHVFVNRTSCVELHQSRKETGFAIKIANVRDISIDC